MDYHLGKSRKSDYGQSRQADNGYPLGKTRKNDYDVGQIGKSRKSDYGASRLDGTDYPLGKTRKSDYGASRLDDAGYPLGKTRTNDYDASRRDLNTHGLGATRANDSGDFGFDWMNSVRYDWDASRKDEFQTSRGETPEGWNAFGATLRDEHGRSIRDPAGRTVKENLGQRVDLGATGDTRRENFQLAQDSYDLGYSRKDVPRYHRDPEELSHSRWRDSAPPEKSETFYPIVEPSEYSIENIMQTPDGKQRRWQSVAADKSLINKWHEMFGKIRTQWAPRSGVDGIGGVSDISDNRSSEIENEGLCRRRCREGLIFMIVMVAIGLLVAAIVPAVLLSTSNGDDGETIIIMYEYEVRADNRNYTTELADSNSDAFREEENEFCDVLDRNAENTTDIEYNGCKVTEIRNGSLIITYVLVVTIPTSSQRPTPADVSLVVGITLNIPDQIVGSFSLTGALFKSEQMIEADQNPVRKKVNFNETCSTEKDDRCVTKDSECRAGLCSCPIGFHHNSDADNCLQIDCGPTPSINNGMAEANGTIYGTELSIACDLGFELSSNITRTCVEPGTWGETPTCELVVCNSYTTPENSQADSNTTGRTYLDIINISCNVGYAFDSGSSDVTCQADKSWSDSPTCSPIVCQEPQISEHATVNPSMPQYQYNDTVTVECDIGYNLQGNETIICQQSETWTQQPTCERIKCEPFYLPAYSSILLTKDLYDFNENVTITCIPGYDIVGVPTVTCLANSSWTDLPTCNPISCMSFNPPENANITGDTSALSYGDVITMNCKTGFTRIGEQNITCKIDSTWPEVDCVLINCTVEFNPSENSIVISRHENEQTLDVGCISGYDIIGNTTVTCIDGTTWSDSPTCQIKDCGNPDDVQNSIAVEVINTTFGSTFSVDCEQGYTLSGESTVTCLSSGIWSTHPTCEIVSCGTYSIPDNAVINKEEGTTYEKQVTFECSTGYEMIGDAIIVCQQNSTWTQNPMCEVKDCGTIADIENGIVTTQTGTTVGSIAYISCKEGFDIVGKRNVSCLESGKWEELPTCKNTSCGEYDPPEHTSIGPNNTIICDEGYETHDNNMLECINGKWSEITGCQPVKCIGYPDVLNANMPETTNKTYNFGMTVEIDCIDGYEVANDNNNTRCGKNETWENVPECTRVVCNDFAVPNHATVGNQLTTNRVFEDMISVDCSNGYNLDGGNSSTCGVNKEWIDIPSCIPISCQEFTLPEHSIASSVKELYVFNEIVNVSCEAGYSFGVENFLSTSCMENGSWPDISKCFPIQCEELDLPDNANKSIETNGLQYKQNVTISCDIGFEVDGNGIISCNSSGAWPDIPGCSPITCEEPQVPENAEIQNKEGITYGKNVTFVCKQGYNLTGEATVECQWNGSWTQNPVCEIKECGSVGIIDNGLVINSTGTTFGSVAYISCKEGFDIVGKRNVSCLESGEWEELPTCKNTSCGEYGPPEHTSIGPNNTIICDEGYETQDHNMLECINGNWSEITGCQPVKCIGYPDVLNTNMPETTNKTYNFGMTVEIDCIDGYEVANGKNNTRCGKNETWENVPECTRVVCNDFAVPNHATVGNQTTTNRVFEDMIYVDCSNGYNLDGGNSSTCGVNKEWIDIPSCIPISCQEFTLPEHSIASSAKELYVFNEIVNVSCEAGYSFGVEKILSTSCMENGSWPDISKCFPIQCEELVLPDNANKSIETNGLQYKQNVTISCDIGFEVDGNGIISCNSSGAWPDIPGCSPITCQEPQVPENAEIQNKEGITYGKNVTFVCKQGYNLTGEATVECQWNGSWTQNPLCEIIECESIVDNGLVINSTGTTFGSVAYISCKEGFDIVGKRNVSCLESGKWEELPTCKNTSCGEYGPPEHTSIGPNNTIICDEGYEAQDNNMLECINGNWSEITGCQPVKCIGYPVVLNANMSETTNITYNFGKTVGVVCNGGYEVSNESKNTTCGKNGTWENVPECTRVVCNDFAVPNNATVGIQNTTNRVFEDKILVSCLDGYILEGGNASTCSENREWINVPSCSPIPCTNFSLPEHSIAPVVKGSYVFNDIINVTCETGYIIKGRGFERCLANQSWTNTSSCEPNGCDFLDVPNSDLRDAEQPRYVFNENITVVCKGGYVLNGSSQVNCQSDGTWEDVPRCDPHMCEELVIPTNAVLAGSQNVYYFNETIILKCDAGYELDNNSTLSCLPDGTWPNLPNCNPIKCIEPSVSENAYMVSDTKEYHFNETVTVACKDGYMLESDASFEIVNGTVAVIRCGADGKWIGDPVCSIKGGCENFTTETYFVEWKVDIYPINTSIPVNCIDGLNITDGSESNVTCDLNGQWQGMPECSIPGQVMFSEDKYDFPEGTDASIVCMISQYPNWQKVMIAKVEGNPNDMNNPVTPIIALSKEHGSLSNNTFADLDFKYTEMPEGISITLYMNSSKCNDGEMYTCAAIVGDVQSPIAIIQTATNVSILCSDQCGDYEPMVSTHYVDPYEEVISVNTTLPVTCVDGLEFTNESVTNVTCGADGVWQGEPECKIPGKIMFTENNYAFTHENNASIVCMISQYPNWQKVMIAKVEGNPNDMNNPVTPIIALTKEHGSLSNNTFADLDFKYTEMPDGISITLFMNSSKCNDGEMYTCAAIVGDVQSPIAIIQTATNVSILCSDQCGDYQPMINTHYVDPYEGVISVNTTLPVTCVDGLEFTNESVTNVTCGADGVWQGEPECKIPGKVMFTENNYAFTHENNASIVCMISQYPNWQKVVIAKVEGNPNDMNNPVTPIIALTKEHGSLSNNTFADLEFKYTEMPDGISITLFMNFSKCNDGEMYTCAAIVGDVQSPIAITQTATNVSILCSDQCGDYQPMINTHYVDPYDGVISVNTTLPVTCVDGLDFTNESVTNVTCGADGVWQGEPECKLSGTVSLSNPEYFIKLNDSGKISCYVKNNPNWQHVIVKKLDGTDVNVVYVSNVNNSAKVTDDRETAVRMFDVNAMADDGGVTVTISFTEADCESEGWYTCTVVVGENPNNPIDSKTTNTSVMILTESVIPTIEGPDTVYQGQESEVSCRGEIGRDSSGQSTGTLWMVTDFWSNGTTIEYGSQGIPKEENCRFVETVAVTVPTDTGEPYLWAKCVIRPLNETETDLESAPVNISVKTSYVSFKNTSYVFNIGEKAEIVCNVVNIKTWTRITISSDNGLVFAVNDTFQTTLGGAHIRLDGDTSELSDDNVKLTVVFDQVQCSDNPINAGDSSTFTCSVYTDGESIEATTSIKFQRLPGIPQLTISHQIVEGQDTWSDRLFTCSGDIGNPPGHIEIESDFDGKFETLLISKDTASPYASVYTNTIKLSECENNQTVSFLLKNVSTKYMHLKSLRCVTKPSKNITDGEIMYSDEKAIKVVPNDYCEGSTSESDNFYKEHPYFCNSVVLCNKDGSINGVPTPCSECADTTAVTNFFCTSCDPAVVDKCIAKGVLCDKTSDSAYEGSMVTFTCNIQDYEEVSQVAVNGQDGVNIDDIDKPYTVYDRINVTVTGSSVIIMMTNVTCGMEGDFIVKLNNEVNINLTLAVMSEPGTPELSVPDEINANQMMEISCMGNVGRDKDGKNSTAIYLSIKFENSDVYEVYSDKGSRQSVEDNCEISETVIYSLTPSTNWNNSYVRCIAKHETGIVSFSTEERLLLLVPELFCQPLQQSANIGASASFVCSLKDNPSFTSVILQKNGTDLINEVNLSLPAELSYDNINITFETSSEFKLDFFDTTCDQEGTYQIMINNVLDASVSLRIITPVMEPSLNMTSSGRVNEQYEISCTGDVGRNEDGECMASLYLETKRESGADFLLFEKDVTYNPAEISECSCMKTVRLILFPDASWNNTEIRCVAGNKTNTIASSISQRINLDEPSTRFEYTEMTGVVGEYMNLTCIVANIPELSDITIYQGENRTIVASYHTGSVLNDVIVLTTESSINTSAGVFKVSIKLQCGEDGMYFCKPTGTDTPSEAVTSVTMQRKPSAPKLTLSREIIENKYTLGDRLFYCEGDLGDPAGSIEIQSDFDGTFKTFLSPTLKNNSIGWITNEEKELTRCKNVTRLSFAFHKATMDLHAKHLRCVIHPSDTIIEGEKIYDEKTVYVIEEDYCVGNDGVLEHPYFCHLGVLCSDTDDGILGVPPGCSEELCYNINQVCVDCSKVTGQCNATEQMNTTTTNTTTTPMPDTKRLSSPSLLFGSQGKDLELKCEFINIDIDFNNLTDSPVIVRVESNQYTLNNSNSFTTSNGIEISLTTNEVILIFKPLECKHAGTYTFSYEDLTSTSEVDLKANVSTPTISQEPSAFYRNQKVLITCVGEVGWPPGDMVLQVSGSDADDTWTDITDVTKVQNDTNLCAKEITINHEFFVSDNDAGKQFRCTSTGHNSDVEHSTILNVEIANAAIYFTQTSETVEIGNSLQIICSSELVSTAIYISRISSILGEERLCNISESGTVTCKTTRLSGVSTTSGSNVTITVSMDTIVCEDEGTYYCGPIDNPSLQAAMTLSTTRQPSVNPVLSIPIRTVLDYTVWNEPVECIADVGYPAGTARIEYSDNNFTTVGNFNVGLEKPEEVDSDNCSVTKTIKFTEVKFDRAWNKTDLRCAVYSHADDTVPVRVSDITTIQLIENVCLSDENNQKYLYHPVNCHHYIYCNGIHPVVISNCGDTCPDIQNGTFILCGDCSSRGC